MKLRSKKFVPVFNPHLAIEKNYCMQSEELIPRFSKALSQKAEIKQNLLRELSSVCDESTLNLIKNAKSPLDLAQILVEKDISYSRSIDELLFCSEGNFAKVKLSSMGKKITYKPFTLEIEQFVYKNKLERGNFLLACEKAMHIPSTKSNVIAIENVLKKQYGVKFVSLKDEEKIAKEVLNACEVAKQNNIKLPENIVVSDCMHVRGEHLRSDKGDIVLLARCALKPIEGELSTTASFHVPLHEILHGTHLPILSFLNKKIPKEFVPVAKELSLYSARSTCHETFTELYVKKLVEGLNDKEQALFNYLS